MIHDNTASHLQALDGGYLPVRGLSLEEATQLDPPPLDRLTAWYRIFQHAHPAILQGLADEAAVVGSFRSVRGSYGAGTVSVKLSPRKNHSGVVPW